MVLPSGRVIRTRSGIFLAMTWAGAVDWVFQVMHPPARAATITIAASWPETERNRSMAPAPGKVEPYSDIRPSSGSQGLQGPLGCRHIAQTPLHLGIHLLAQLPESASVAFQRLVDRGDGLPTRHGRRLALGIQPDEDDDAMP